MSIDGFEVSSEFLLLMLKSAASGCGEMITIEPVNLRSKKPWQGVAIQYNLTNLLLLSPELFINIKTGWWMPLTIQYRSRRRLITMIYIQPLVIALFVALFATKTVVAHEAPEAYDRINFQVNAAEEVENDTLIVVMYSERSGQKPSVLADEVNRNIGWAVDLAKKSRGIKLQTLNYRQEPLYNNQNISGWRVRQSIRLESTDVAVLSELVGEMQRRLSIESIRYAVSPALRDRVESRLIAEALNRFKRRGEQIQIELGRTGYRIVNVDVITSSQSPAPMRMRTSAMMESSVVTAPSLEPGVQSLSVQVSGTIELETPQ